MLTRRAPLRRSWMRRGSRKSSYAQRPRAIDYMLFVKTLPCCALAIDREHPCSGPVEADHAGAERGLSQKAHDSTCIALCRLHHRQRHDFSGPFKDWERERMRSWLVHWIYLTQRMASGKGVIVPRVEAT